MAHRALTLKYRPQVFADLVGQDHVSMVLARALESGRTAQAYLFTGARGVGKTTSARILAKALNCERRASGKHPGPDPCNQCTSCNEITNGVSLDVTEIDGASNRGIADVQALREKVRFSPTGGRHRVVIIDEVHQLSNDAFAALLKTLEEPPPHLVFIFATTDPQKLPDTIRSRTQRYDFARVPLRKVADRLLDIAARESKDPDGVKFTLTEGAALLIAHKSEGALRDAVSALDQVVSSGEREVDEELVRRILGLADREAFFALAEAIVGRDPKQALHRLHEAFEKGLDARDLAEGLSEHVRHILILKVDPQGADLVAASASDLERLRSQGEGWSENDLLRLLKIASEVMGPMRDSPQPLIHLEAAILQMATLEPGESLADLLARLEALERRLDGGPAGSAASPARGRSATARGSASGVAGAAGASSSLRGGPAWSAGPAGGEAASRAQVSGAAHVSSAAAPRVQASAPAAAGAMAQRGAAGGTAGGSAREAGQAAGLAAPVSGAASTTGLAEPATEIDEATGRCWEEAIARINSRKRMLGAFLEESRFVGNSGDELLLAMDDLHRAVVEEKENWALLAEEVLRSFGRPLVVRCMAPEGATARKPAASDVKEMIEKTIAWFGGEAVNPADRRPERTRG